MCVVNKAAIRLAEAHMHKYIHTHIRSAIVHIWNVKQRLNRLNQNNYGVEYPCDCVPHRYYYINPFSKSCRILLSTEKKVSIHPSIHKYISKYRKTNLFIQGSHLCLCVCINRGTKIVVDSLVTDFFFPLNTLSFSGDCVLSLAHKRVQRDKH